MITESQILAQLKQVEDPDLHQDIVSLGFVKNIQITNSEISFDIELTTPACPVKDLLKEQAMRAVSQLSGVKNVKINMTSNVRARTSMAQGAVLPNVKNIIAVASGKGGVGKSTVAANLALALASSGAQVGLLDSDIYGPSAPTMFGVHHQPEVDATQQIVPIVQHGIKLMSMGFLSTDDSPVIWRGPMVHGIIQQFLTRVNWGVLDYLVIDLPPGTGDAQLSLTQSAPISGAVIVTTPQEVSLIDARKGLKMFQKVNVPLLGIVENMSFYVCSDCGKKAHIFRSGGGMKTAQELKVPFLGEIPLDGEVAEAGDAGIPIVAKNPTSEISRAYLQLAGRVAAELSIVNIKSEGSVQNFKLAWKT